MKVGCLKVSFELLQELLLLPEGVEVDSVMYDGLRNCLAVKVKGDALPERCKPVPGGQLVWLDPQYKETRTAHFCGWDC